MIAWLKYFFLGFFSNRLAKEGAERSMWNTLLSVLLAFVLLCGGLTAGYAASCGTHYDSAEDYRAALYKAFASADAVAELKLEGGKMTAELADGLTHINGYSDEFESCNTDGVYIVVDTRPMNTTFDDFEIKCVNGSGDEITFDEYRAMGEEDRKSVTLTFKYSGRDLDPKDRLSIYESYLDAVSDENDALYDSDVKSVYYSLRDDLQGGKISADEYAIGVYSTYIKSYYLGLIGPDSYGSAPTLRAYYLRQTLTSDCGSYIMILDDMMLCLFNTPNGITVSFSGGYSKVDGGDINTSDKIDAMMKAVVGNSAGLEFIIYALSLVRGVLIFAAVLLLLALITYLICKNKDIEFGKRYFSALKTIGGFSWFSAVIAFVGAIVLSFFVDRGAAALGAQLIFLFALVIRFAVLFAAELVKKSREAAPAPDDEEF